MQVPIKRTPGTSVVALQQPYERAAPGLDVSPILKPLEGFAKEIKKTQNDLEDFDVKSRVLQETNDLQSDFERRKEAAPLGDPNFTQQTLTDYTARHDKLVSEFQQRGYSDEALQTLSLRLGALREHFGEQALVYQVHSTAVAADSKVDELATNGSQYVANNPVTGYASTLAEVRDAIDRLPGDATYKEERYQRARALIRQGGLQALARMHPEQVITALDPQGLTAPPAVPAGGAYDVVRGVTSPGGNGGAASAIDHILSNEGGYNPKDANGYPTNFGINLDANRAELAALGITDIKNMTKDQARQIYQNKYWKESGAANLPAAVQGPYLDVYIRSPKNAKRLWDESGGDPVKFAQSSQAYFANLATQPKYAKYKHAWAVRDAGNLALVQQAAATSVSTQAASAPPSPTSSSGTEDEIVVTGQRPPDLNSVRTGIAILDDANGSERLQALMQAREETNRKSTALKSSLDIVVQNADAAIGLPGGYNGPKPSKDVFIQVYGPIEGEQKYAAFTSSLHTNEVVQTIQTLNPTAIAAQVESLRPNPASPTLATDMQRYEAAQRAQQHVLQMRKDDPAAYVLQAFPNIATQMQNAQTSSQRAAAYTAMERAFDQLQIPENERTYLTDDARAQMVQQYKVASPQQKLGLIETWINEMGGRPGRLLHGEVDTNQDVAMYRTLSQRGGDFRRTFLQVLEGQDIIAKDPARKPSPESMNAAFTAMPGRIQAINNLSPDVSRMYNEAAAALYVQRGGRTGPQGVLTDNKLYDQALREVMGGNSADPNSGFVDLGHGRARDHTILPPGITAKQFEDWRDGLVGSSPGHVGDLTRLSVRGLPPTDNRGNPLSLHDIQDQGVFVMVAPGTYGIKLSSDGNFVGDRTGQPFLIRLDPQTILKTHPKPGPLQAPSTIQNVGTTLFGLGPH